jgi:hypothetical protein
MKYEIRFPTKPQGSYRWARRAYCAVVREDHPHKTLTKATRQKTWWLINGEVDLRSAKQIAAAREAAETFIAKQP